MTIEEFKNKIQTARRLENEMWQEVFSQEIFSNIGKNSIENEQTDDNTESWHSICNK
jgi:hypothetical protein